MSTDSLAAFVVPTLLATAFIAAVLIAARRYGRRQRRAKLWDAHGPVRPTLPPRDWGPPPGVGPRPPRIEREDEHT